MSLHYADALALALADELASVLTYDERMNAAASTHGLHIETPGR